MAFNPFFFCDSPLPLELIHKALGELREVIPTVNELKAKVDKLISDLDGAIQAEVQKVIDEMYENGELENILKRYAQDFLTNRPLSSQVDFARIFRVMQNSGDNYRYLSPQGVRASYLQGGCKFTVNGIDYVAYCLITLGSQSNYHDNYGALIIRELNTFNLAGQVYLNCDHMNSMAYNPKDGGLYIAHAVTYEAVDASQAVKTTKLTRVSFNEVIGKNLNIVDLYYLSHDANAEVASYKTCTINYPSGTDMTSVVAYDDSLNAYEIYAGWERGLYKLTFDMTPYVSTITASSENLLTNTMLNEISRAYNQQNWTAQDTDLTKDYIYLVCYNPSMLIRINRTTEKIDYIYNIPKVVSNGHWRLGELECATIDENGDCYIFCCHRPFTQRFNTYDMTQIFKQNLFYNNVPLPQRYTSKKRITVYVDRFCYSKNPNGLYDINPSKNKAFQNIVEAVDFANECETATGVTIIMVTDSNYFIQISTNKSISIQRCALNSEQFNYNFLGDSNRPEIGGIWINGCNNVMLETLDIHLAIPDSRFTAGELSGNAGYITAYEANIFLNYIYVTPNSEAMMSAYRCNDSFVSLTGANRFTVGTAKTEDNVEWVNGETYFLSGTCSTANAHGFATTNDMILG